MFIESYLGSWLSLPVTIVVATDSVLLLMYVIDLHPLLGGDEVSRDGLREVVINSGC
jgi:hypothetical protein